ncbi:MAG: ABC transporter ATP-binding protein [Hahellaceae bacterium]|nr:ABC transporter ATP-binding protein [Hahellaceae bacterium]MCP5168473.1 ABC transporter ATP-binding protein [Hahellaceae bacterium]
MIIARRVSKLVQSSEGPLSLLENISLELPRGESLAIVGASGSGKSTLLGILAGLDIPTEGQILLSGHDITQVDEEQRADIRAQMTGFVFQSFQLLPGLTALENVMLPLELFGIRKAAERSRQFLDKVGLSHRLTHYPKQLSGGEQQRVAIARAFANNPAILFADEPTGNLDTATGKKIIDLLFELNRDQGTTLVLVTHEPRLAERCTQVLTLEGGKIRPSEHALRPSPC